MGRYRQWLTMPFEDFMDGLAGKVGIQRQAGGAWFGGFFPPHLNRLLFTAQGEAADFKSRQTRGQQSGGNEPRLWLG